MMRWLLPRLYVGFSTAEPVEHGTRVGIIVAVAWLGLHLSLGGGVGEPR